MAQLLIRKLPDAAKSDLRQRAARNGRSMEAEARQILVDVLSASENDLVIEWLDAAAELREWFDEGLIQPARQPSREVTEL